MIIHNMNQITKHNRLQIIEARLGNNQISNISPLAKLVNLKYLYLHNNQIRDISPLDNLKKLTNINYKNNPLMSPELLKCLKEFR